MLGAPQGQGPVPIHTHPRNASTAHGLPDGGPLGDPDSGFICPSERGLAGKDTGLFLCPQVEKDGAAPPWAQTAAPCTAEPCSGRKGGS